MTQLRTRTVWLTPLLALFALAALFDAPAAKATHHGWKIVEAFSNADGTLQFVEFARANRCW